MLVFLDARAGVSPLLELPFGADGEPGAAVVRTPVSQPYAPPELLPIAWATGEVEVVYSAIGRAAMTAIGRIPLRRTAEPVALSLSRGYGPLSFAAALNGASALFALEVPSAAPPTSPRTLALERVTELRVDDVATLDDPAGVHHPSVASAPEPGVFLLAYTRGTTLHAVTVVCAAPR